MNFLITEQFHFKDLTRAFISRICLQTLLFSLGLVTLLLDPQSGYSTNQKRIVINHYGTQI